MTTKLQKQDPELDELINKCYLLKQELQKNIKELVSFTDDIIDKAIDKNTKELAN